MINDSARILREKQIAKEVLDFKYIIVDEFQDISQSRTKFLQKLIEHGNAKLFAVGDDWQSIFAFSGSKIEYIYNFLYPLICQWEC